jgi:16S rRNA (guanine(966)-N(2))-methyltransferase RsmD
MLGDLTGKAFLDLYAGSGNVGLEALSRGAGFACFVESDARLAGSIRTTLEQFGYAQRAEVLTRDVARGIAGIAQRGMTFDIIFADPPYDEGLVAKTLQGLAGGGILAREGLLVLQHSLREMPEPLPEGKISATDQRRYGDTVLSFFIPKP